MGHARHAGRACNRTRTMLTRRTAVSTIRLPRRVEPWFHVGEFGVSGRDLILSLAGMALIGASLHCAIPQG